MAVKIHPLVALIVTSIFAGCAATRPASLSEPLEDHPVSAVMNSYLEHSVYCARNPGDWGTLHYTRGLRNNVAMRIGCSWEEQEAIQAEQIQDGWPMDMVLLSWGAPWGAAPTEKSPMGTLDRYWWGRNEYKPWGQVTALNDHVMWWTKTPENRNPVPP